MYKGLRGYWRRKGYTRIDGGTGFRRKNRVELTATLGPATNSSTKKVRFWRIKLKPKFRFGSPKKFLKRIRDAYVNLMLGFANSRVFSSGFGGVGSLNYGYGGGAGAFGKPQLKEYDEKVLVDFYRSLMAQGTLMPRDAAKIVSTDGIGCRI